MQARKPISAPLFHPGRRTLGKEKRNACRLIQKRKNYIMNASQAVDDKAWIKEEWCSALWIRPFAGVPLKQFLSRGRRDKGVDDGSQLHCTLILIPLLLRTQTQLAHCPIRHTRLFLTVVRLSYSQQTSLCLISLFWFFQDGCPSLRRLLLFPLSNSSQQCRSCWCWSPCSCRRYYELQAFA